MSLYSYPTDESYSVPSSRRRNILLEPWEKVLQVTERELAGQTEVQLFYGVHKRLMCLPTVIRPDSVRFQKVFQNCKSRFWVMRSNSAPDYFLTSNKIKTHSPSPDWNGRSVGENCEKIKHTSKQLSVLLSPYLVILSCRKVTV
uniref:Uncharacterized protein n=1 Tax=Anabas testudineus TaxID=64144 RepID=A0A7N6FM68_ANATE